MVCLKMWKTSGNIEENNNYVNFELDGAKRKNTITGDSNLWIKKMDRLKNKGNIDVENCVENVNNSHGGLLFPVYKLPELCQRF